MKRQPRSSKRSGKTHRTVSIIGTGSYVPVFVMAGFAYLAALLVIHLLVPRLEPANLET